MKTYNAFIFDMNGTIIDDMPFQTQAWVKMLADQGKIVSEDEFALSHYGKTNGETLREVWGRDLPEAQITALSLEKEKAYQKIYEPHLAPIAGFRSFLQAAVASGQKVVLATSAIRFSIDFVLKGLGLEEEITAVVGAEDIQHSKPHPEIFLKAAQLVGAAPEACLVFEDSLSGLEAARRAHMDAYAILTTFTEAEVPTFPNIVGAAPDYTTIPRALFRTA
ncbi:MAG: beta-phosphoglucomutase [Chloroflexi bacterium]|nr:MAG: beta-phosphoglucomutase [Chloroflexota bacterium]